MNKNLLALFIFLSPILTLSAQKGHPSVGRPLDIPAVFAGNFGELRPNHFHSGLDFKTQGRTGLPIRAIDDGYVSRCLVSPWGFGRAIYIVHPETGLTSVYGHLESFASKIDDIVRDAQYQNETFSIDLDFEPNEIPVKRGEIIALSGNAGSSGGPHLHMDIRDTATGDALDPMEFYRQYVNDNVAPEVRQIGLYPVPDKGVVDGSANGKALVPAEFSKGFTAWGKVTPGINAYDRMSGTSNIYGVKYLT
ncbi:MAG: M23 family metallopeptidase, partial [Muribaculaceae bacterium]|nr:M23 family metallopeptidase [Muribaculaceae bacterium]